MIKQALRELLDLGRLQQIGEMSVRRKRILGSLVALTYDKDTEIGWRAVEAMGVAARRIAETDPEYVREHLRRLYWLMSEESGGICWHAPEAIAEIICQWPEQFTDYVPIVVSLLLQMAEEDLDHFRAGTLWAIGRLGAIADNHIDAVLGAIASALDSPDPQVRGMAVWCLGRVGEGKVVADRSDLLSDEGTVTLYENGMLHRTSVRQLAKHSRHQTHRVS